jgi:hypothetical protein
LQRDERVIAMLPNEQVGGVANVMVENYLPHRSLTRVSRTRERIWAENLG